MWLIDTDSLIYKIEVENVYEDFLKDKELFDFCNCPQDSKYCNNAKFSVAGKIKDETCGVPIKAFLALKSKMYTFITEDNHESKRH